MTPIPTFPIGGTLPINRLGYGAMRLTGQPGNFGPYADWEGGKRLLRRAVELGVNFIDTAHPYGPGFNEELIADALAPYPPGLVVTTKGGVEKTAPSNIYADGRPEALRQFCEGSLRRLKLEAIPLYQLHRPDPKTPFGDSIAALAALRSEGKILHVGLSNVTLAQIEEAQRIVPIASVQNRYNIDERADDPVVDYCQSQNIAYLPWAPLAARPMEPGVRLNVNARLETVARAHGATTAQTALAWLLHRAPNVVLIPGTTNAGHLEENFAAGKIQLSADEMHQLTRGARKYRVVLDLSRIGENFAKSEGFLLPDHAWEQYLADLGFTPSGDGAWIADAKSVAGMGDAIVSKTPVE
jgi:aryl-alcohol dehydrogenase-like predicted oxidoreductase